MTDETINRILDRLGPDACKFMGKVILIFTEEFDDMNLVATGCVHVAHAMQKAIAETAIWLKAKQAEREANSEKLGPTPNDYTN